MLAFLLLASRDGVPIAPAELARATAGALPNLPFQPESSLVWTNRSASTVVLAWQAFTENARVGSHWHVNREGGLSLFAGHCWPRVNGWDFESDENWASQLTTWLG